ncbi:MAG: hypothetical protein H6R11_648 [Proteobacteria bacterium]|jgi:hypothetical protein|nr:hypothetical protein [Pseudomonadota bacterium]MBS1172054.1 hypothetical protein [Pseudomonadota bacterium]
MMHLSPASCPPCHRFVQRHRKAIRRAVGLTLLAGFLFWVGANAPVVTTPQLCKVYG